MLQHRIEVIKAMFSDLIFEEQRHLYFVDDIPYPSVSKLVSEHAPKFNAEFILPHSAKKNNTTVPELRKKWKDYNKERCDIGTNTHSFLEKYNGLQTPRNGYEQAGASFIKDMSVDHEIIFREIRMYSRKYKYAGTEDLILMNKHTGDIIAADYKTNVDLFKCYKGQTLYEPFETLESTPYNKIQLQLSYYQIMLEEANCTVSDRILVHLKPEGTYKIFHTLDLTKELKSHMSNKKSSPVYLW